MLGERVFKTIHRWGGVATVLLTGAAIISAAAADKLANLVIGAAMVACILTGLRQILESMMDRIANDSYDSGKTAERRAIVRDLAEYMARRNNAS